MYVGVTNNLKKRLHDHKNPEVNSKQFTHKYNCKYLIYYEHYQSIDIAIQREKQIKKWRREKKEQLINSKNPTW